jgi:hypothetical protein
MAFPLGCSLFLPVHTVNCVQTLKVSKELPDLKRVPGVSDWKVMERDGGWYGVLPLSNQRLIATDCA